MALTGNNKHGANLDHGGEHGASHGCWHRRFVAAAGCVTCVNTRADHAFGSRTQHAAPGMSWATTRRPTDSWPASTALLRRTPLAPATRCCTCERHVRVHATEAALDSTAPHAACACCHERGGARHAATSTSGAAAAGITCQRTCVLSQLASEHAQVCFIHWRRPATSWRMADRIGIHTEGSTRMHGCAMTTSVAAHNRKLDTTGRAL